MAYFKDTFRSIFNVKDTPQRIALAFAMGVFMGISPLLGLHYILALFLAWILRLNKLVAVVGVSVNNPWTIVPISSFCVWIGAKLMGIKQVLPEVDWGSVSLTGVMTKLTDLDNFILLVKELMPLIKSFFVGSFLIGTISAVISYFIIQPLATKYQKKYDAS